MIASHGTPDDPLNDAEVLAKFTTNATRRIPAEQATRIADFVARLELSPPSPDSSTLAS